MLISADISYFQKKVDNSYPRQWLIFRCCDGDFMDPNATFNANWCRGAVIEGRLKGWSTYVVYRPGENAAVLANLAKIVPLDRVMIDVESWGGAIRGDHSEDVNQLLDDLAAIVGQAKVWLYGNLSNLNEICPRRRPWVQLVIASWGANKPNVPNMIGWQYTDGAHAAGGRPLSSAPFGACDHNELYVDELSPSGGGDLLEDDMPAWFTQEEWDRVKDESALTNEAVGRLERQINGPDPDGRNTAYTVDLTYDLATEFKDRLDAIEAKLGIV